MADQELGAGFKYLGALIIYRTFPWRKCLDNGRHGKLTQKRRF